jgi:hypothetical protein
MPTNKIDSNLTGLRYADETSLGVVPGGAVWKPLEPNSYGDFGGSTAVTARNTLNASRQRKKGVVTSKDSKGAFELDLTLDNMYDLLQGFMFADWRKKGELFPTAVAAGSYTVAANGTLFRANDLLVGSGFGVAANNGVKIVTAAAAGSVTATGAVLEAGPPAIAQIDRIGHQFAAGDATLTITAGVAALVTTTKNLTELGLIPGEWVWLGGDQAAEQFVNAVNRGFARVDTIAANKITFSKTSNVFVADAGTAKTVRIFIGDVLKNESDPTLIKTRSYHLERSLSSAGYEYVKGAVPNELSIKLSAEDKVTVNLNFIGTDSETAAFGAQKAGTRPALTSSSVAFNTSSDFSRLRLDKVDNTGLASFLAEASVEIKNGVTPLKALGKLGSFDVSLGDFMVAASVTAYFNDIAAVDAVNANVDTSLDFALCTRNTAMLFDMPLLSIGASKLQVAKDAPIKLPLAIDAAAHATLDHTLLVNSFGYLPTIAEA